MSLVADRILSLAVQRVRENCRLAMIEVVTLNYDPRDGTDLHPLTRAHATNREILLGAAMSAQLVLDDQIEAAKRHSRQIPDQREADDNE